MAFSLLFASCRQKPAPASTPIVHNSEIDIWPDSIDFHNGVILRAYADSILQVRVEGHVLRTISLPPLRENAFGVKTDFPVFDALYRLEASAPGPEGWWRFTPYEIYLCPLDSRRGIRLLAKRKKNGYIIPPETRRYSWPVINDNGLWLLAACELFRTGADRRWLATIGETAQKVIGEDCKAARNPATGLFFGIPRYMAGVENLFPRWMAPSDIFATQSMAVNASYWGALNSMNAITSEMARKNENSHLPEMPVDADSLLHAINRELWMPNTGCYSALLYGAPATPLQLQSSDNLAQGLAVVTGLTSTEMGKAVIRNTPLSPAGISNFYPTPSPDAPLADIAPAACAFWAVATARNGSWQAYDTAVGALLYSAASYVLTRQDNSPRRFDNLISGLVLRGFLGMKFAFDGIWFQPSVPHSMPGHKTITDMRYRKAIFDISVEGTGTVITSFTIDGKTAEPFVHSGLEGRHKIEIVLAGNHVENGNPVNKTEGAVLPSPPIVEWASTREAAILPQVGAGAKTSANGHKPTSFPTSYSGFVYLDGVLTEELASHTYHMYDAPDPVTVQFVSVENNRLVSFSAEPRLYIPQGKLSMIYLASVAKGGTRIIQDKQIAARFVESDRRRNRDLAFDYTAPHDGEYMVDVHYISGLGIVNPRRRTALRSLYIDGGYSGIFVFPQQTPMSRDAESGNRWQNLTAFSNPLKVRLRKGRNRIMMRLYQPTPVYIDPTANTIVADFVRIIDLGEKARPHDDVRHAGNSRDRSHSN